jgi:Fe2+ or Zn2+ uptake regulation protein/O6-methylguanine-DNA--protein-cysteine methyltransferase
VTPQRRAILGAFRGTSEEHLSAEEVLSRAGAAVPEIGRGTVYAALAELTELGLLASVGQTEAIRYETNVEPHDHFYCRLCLRMFDIDVGSGELLARSPEGYAAEQVLVRVEGVCASCIDYHRGLADGAASAKRQPTLDVETLEDLACAVTQSPVGELGLVATDDGIARLAFGDHADFDSIAARARRHGIKGAQARLRHLDEALRAYLAGVPTSLTDAIDWGLMVPATAAALRPVLKIPYGEYRSYDEVCSLTPYDCGRAMGSNPIPLLIPCHRVRCGTHRPEAYVGGPERLRFLHRMEDAANT